MKFIKISDSLSLYINANYITELFRTKDNQPCIKLLNNSTYIISEKAYNSLLKI